MKMKSILALAVCACAAAVFATSTPKGFTEDLDAALAEAKTSGKLVYACFSGSDWCIWCKRLEGEVFADKTCDFVGSLKDDYLFVFIDSPRDKSVLSDAAKERNPKLTKQYAIKGFPTALLLDGEGKQVGKTGYRAGGAKPYVSYLKLFRKHGEKVDEQMRAVQKKYFGALDDKANTAFTKLRGNQKPTLETLESLKATFETLAQEAKDVKVAADDADFAELAKADKVANFQRIVKMMEASISREKANEKK